MQIVIETAVIDDYRSIADLVKTELGYVDIDAEKLKTRMYLMESDCHYVTYVAKYSGLIVGFISLRRGLSLEIDGEYMQIIDFAVQSSLQNKGIGSQLLQHAEKYVKEKNLHHITLNYGFQRVNSHTFYEHKGFTKKSYSFKKYI